MEQRELGRSGVAVSRIVLGCGNFGGIGSAPAFFGQGIPEDEAFRLLDAAWELGVTTFDTADAYGGGRSETFIGEWLATKGPEVRDRVVDRDEDVQPDDGGRRPRARGRADPPADRDEPRAGSASSASPLYLAHDFDPDVPQEETLHGVRRARPRRATSARSARRTSPPSSSPRRSSSRRSRGSPATSWCRTPSRSSTRTTARPSSRSATSTASATRRTARSPAAG